MFRRDTRAKSFRALHDAQSVVAGQELSEIIDRALNAAVAAKDVARTSTSYQARLAAIS